MPSDGLAFGLPPKYQQAITPHATNTIATTYRKASLRGLMIANITSGAIVELTDYEGNTVQYTVVAGMFLDFIPKLVTTNTTATVVAWYG